MVGRPDYSLFRGSYEVGLEGCSRYKIAADMFTRVSVLIYFCSPYVLRWSLMTTCFVKYLTYF